MVKMLSLLCAFLLTTQTITGQESLPNLISKLGHKSFRIRERAMQKIIAQVKDKDIFTLLEVARGDLERTRRAQYIADKLYYRKTPNERLKFINDNFCTKKKPKRLPWVTGLTLDVAEKHKLSVSFVRRWVYNWPHTYQPSDIKFPWPGGDSEYATYRYPTALCIEELLFQRRWTRDRIHALLDDMRLEDIVWIKGEKDRKWPGEK